MLTENYNSKIFHEVNYEMAKEKPFKKIQHFLRSKFDIYFITGFLTLTERPSFEKSLFL
jgi:hypothetical protein